MNPPLPPGSPPNKSRILILNVAGKQHVLPFSQVAEMADSAGRWTTDQFGPAITLQHHAYPGTIYPETVYVVPQNGQMPVDGAIYSFLFAWHAMGGGGPE